MWTPVQRNRAETSALHVDQQEVHLELRSDHFLPTSEQCPVCDKLYRSHTIGQPVSLKTVAVGVYLPLLRQWSCLIMCKLPIIAIDFKT